MLKSASTVPPRYLPQIPLMVPYTLNHRERERERERERDKERETKRVRESEREREREKEPVEESLDSPPEAHPRDIAENLPESGAVGEGSEQPLYKNMQWFRGGLVFDAHRLLYHSV